MSDEPGDRREREESRPEQPGLRLRVNLEARRISSQHRQLDALYAAVAQALEAGEANGAKESFARFWDALDAHFTLEDRLYFPALHGLRQELEGELAQLVREHREFRRDLEHLKARIDGGDLSSCGALLEQLAVALAAHELREEQLVERLGGASPLRVC